MRTQTVMKRLKRQEQIREWTRALLITTAVILSFALCVAAAGAGIAIGNYMELNKTKTTIYKQKDRDDLTRLIYRMDCEVLTTYRCI